MLDGTHGDPIKGWHGKAIFTMSKDYDLSCINFDLLLPRWTIATYDDSYAVPCKDMDFISVTHWGGCGYEAFAKAIGLKHLNAWKGIFWRLVKETAYSQNVDEKVTDYNSLPTKYWLDNAICKYAIILII